MTTTLGTTEKQQQPSEIKNSQHFYLQLWGVYQRYALHVPQSYDQPGYRVQPTLNVDFIPKCSIEIQDANTANPLPSPLSLAADDLSKVCMFHVGKFWVATGPCLPLQLQECLQSITATENAKMEWM